MKINEAKIGDNVSYKNKKGKLVKGTIIHRHDDSNPALVGMVNVQPVGDDAYPETVHISTITKAVKEDKTMKDVRETIDELIDNVESGNHTEAEQLFDTMIQDKIDELLNNKKVEVASSMFNTQECAECEEEQVDEALKGGQHKIDANKNGKVDAHDFKLLRGRKTRKTERMDRALAKRVENNKKMTEEEIVEYQRGLWHPPAGFKKSGIAKGKGVVTTPVYKKKTQKADTTMAMKGKVKEEVEQIDELSPKTMTSYVDKAKKSAKDNEMKSTPEKLNWKAHAKFQKRHKGLSTAYGKMAAAMKKEEGK